MAEDATAANIKLRRLNEKYREFSKAAGLPEQRERIKAYTPLDKVKTTQQASAVMTVTHIDVTDKYYKTATPGSHVVQDLTAYEADGVKYTVDGHYVQLSYSAHEKEIAELLEKELGGELSMVPRVNNPGSVPTPDYLFRSRRFDLKTPELGTGPNTIYNRIKKAKPQAENFVIDVTKCGLNDEVIEEQIEKIYRMKETEFVEEIIIVKNGRIVKIEKRK